MFEIALISHARAADPNNTQSITFNAGKPETEVSGECAGFRMREPWERVHYREDEDRVICANCGKRATVWHGSLDKWQAHPMRCE